MTSLVAADNFLQVKEEDYELALAKSNVKDKTVRDSIASVHEWYRMQAHLPEGGISDGKIFRLLLSTSFSLEKTKQKIDNLLTARSMVPEIMIDSDPCSESFQTLRQFVQYAIVPQRLDDMSRITIFGYKGEDTAKFNASDYLKFTLMASEYLSSSDLCLGEHYIIDLRGVKLGHVTQSTPGTIKKTIIIRQGCHAAKVKSIHYVNIPSYAMVIVSLVKASLSAKVGSRVHAHKDYESLQKCIPKKFLPSDFGGENKSMEELTDEFLAQVTQRRELFLQQDEVKSDESKRVGVGSAMSKELQGMQGSFRTLDID